MKIIKKVTRWLERQERISRTKKELYSLSDRELSDIGLSRCDIDRVSRQRSREPINVAL